MPKTCAVRLLGGFQVEVDGRRVPPEAWRHRRGADLVKLLALAPEHRLHREQVMESLWPDLGPEAASANLRKAVYFARRSLGGMEAIEAEGEVIALWPGGRLKIDAEHIEAEATKALATGAGLDPVANLFTGDLLPDDRYVGWIESHRERLRALHLQVLRAAGRWGQVLDLDPSDEEACRALMQIHLAAGNRQAAIRQFQRLREILRVDLGIGPDPATIAVFEEAVATEGHDLPTPNERAQALVARGLMHWSRRELDSAQRVAEIARQLGIHHHLGRELGEASWLLGMVAFARGQWPECFRQTFAETLDLQTDQAPYVMDAQLCLGEASLSGVHSDVVAGLAHELLPKAIEASSVAGEALLSFLIGSSETLVGRLDDAREWLTRAAGLYEQVENETGHAFVLLRLAVVAVADGNRGEAARLLRTARELAERSELDSHLVVRVFAALLEAADNADRRQSIVTEAEALLRSKVVCGPCSIGLRVGAAIACARSGDLARSRFFLAEAERLAAMWQGSPWQAAVWEARAALRLAEGDRAQAAALLREAAQIYAECGRSLDHARCIAAGAARN